MIQTATTLSPAKLASINALADKPQKLFDITPILHPQNGFHPEHSRTFWTATANALYIVRQDGEDLFGRTPNFTAKLDACPDLVAHGRRGPISCDEDTLSGLQLWRAADEAARQDRPGAPVAWHLVGWLPCEGGAEQWREQVLTFLDQRVVQKGMIADWAIHALADEAGDWIKRPHFHAVITARFWKGPRIGQPQAAWFQTSRQRKTLAENWGELVGLTGEVCPIDPSRLPQAA